MEMVPTEELLDEAEKSGRLAERIKALVLKTSDG